MLTLLLPLHAVVLMAMSSVLLVLRAWHVRRLCRIVWRIAAQSDPAGWFLVATLTTYR
ncbi:hypothetical protein [Streptomyces sp. NPDC002853]